MHACVHACLCPHVCVYACVHARACVSACLRDVFAIHNNNSSPRLIMIIIKSIILYFIQIRHTDDLPSTGTRLVKVKSSPGSAFASPAAASSRH